MASSGEVGAAEADVVLAWEGPGPGPEVGGGAAGRLDFTSESHLLRKASSSDLSSGEGGSMAADEMLCPAL